MIALALGSAWIGAVALAFLDGRRPWVGWTAVGVLAVNLLALLVLTGMVLAGETVTVVAGGWEPGIGIVLRADALGLVFAVVSSTVLLMALLHEVCCGIRTRTFPSLVLFTAAGLTGLFLTGDIFNFYVFFEVSMIAAYVLTAYGEARRQLGAAFIFAVVNLLGSFIFLIAIGSIYHLTGTLEMSAAAEQLAQSETAIIIAVTVLVAFGVKLGLFPFHFWLPAVYGGARPAVAAILGGAIANIGAYGLLRFGAELFEAEVRTGATVLIALGTASIIYGSLQAVSRRTVVEVLAYSAIGQAGFILIALGIGGPVGYGAAVIFALANALNKGLLFLAVDVRGALVGAAFVIGAFSVAGIPPSAGFFAKLAMFRAAIDEAGSVALVTLVFVGGALSFLYMFQIYQARFWREREAEKREPSVLLHRAPAITLALVVLAIGLWPEPLLALGERAAEVLPAGGAEQASSPGAGGGPG